MDLASTHRVARSNTPVSSRATRAAGRNEELDALRRAYRAACDGELRLLVLEGPGKDALLDAWLSEHRAGPVLRVSASRALEPLVESALEELSPVRRARHPAARLLARSDAPSDVSDFLVAAERRLRLREEVLRLLGEIGAPNPAVVVLDGVESADRATLELLRALVAERAPFSEQPDVLVVGTASAPPRGRLAELGDASAARVLSLTPLDRAGVREMLTSPDVVDAVLSLTGGLPELIERLVRGEPIQPPSAYGPDVQAALEALAVLEAAPTHAQLETITGRPVDAAELAHAGATRGVDGWRLSPALRGRVHATLEVARALPLHARAAEVLAEAHPAAATRHALCAGRGELAASLAERAVEQLARAHAPEDAAELLLDVVDARPDAPVQLRRRLVELLWIAGDHASAIERAQALLAERPDDAELAELVGRLLLHAGRLSDAVAVLETADTPSVRGALAEALYRAGELEPADALAASLGDAPIALRLDAENTRAKIELARGETDAAERRLVRILAQAERSGACRQACQALNNLGIVAIGRGELRAAQRHLEGCLALAEECGALFHRGLAHKNLAVARQLDGAWSEALHHSSRALALLSGLVNPNLLARLSFNTADLYRSLGDPYRALRLLAHARDGAELEATVRAEGLRVEAAIHLELGRSEPAEQAYLAALALAEELEQASGVTEAQLGLARLAVENDDTASGARWLELAGDVVGARSQARRAWLRARLAPGDGAIPLGREAVAAAMQTSDPLLVQDARLALARALADAGLAGRAREELRTLRSEEDTLRQRVPEAMRALFDERALRRQLARLERELGGDAPRMVAAADEEDLLVGDGAGMRELRSWIARVGPTESTVLIQGESGTGKELVAEALHRASRRSEKPFVRVNCAALVDTLLSSELFGHERGAFTGADRQKKGRFELADGGTLLLDEIGDISPKMQASLLRVLQSRTFERVGGTRTLEADVRILAATHRDLGQMVEEGTFREDLYYRLSGIRVHVPALRERVEDLGELCRHLLAKIARDDGTSIKTLAPDALEVLERHSWPGNVRELENVLRSAAVLNPAGLLTADDFASLRGGRKSAPPPAGASLGELAYERVRDGDGSIYELRKRLERECIERALDDANGNISRAADLLGMKRPRLSKLVNEWGLKK